MMSNVWFQIYITGCAFAVVAILLNALVVWLVNWMTKTDVVVRNFKKLAIPDERGFAVKVSLRLVSYLLAAALSWLTVALNCWSLLMVPLRAIREAFSSTPEAVLALRFPLRNNPDLTRESVWAYMRGLEALAGQPPKAAADLLTSLREVIQHYPHFDQTDALHHLRMLHVVEPEIIGSTLREIERENTRSFSDADSESRGSSRNTSQTERE